MKEETKQPERSHGRKESTPEPEIEVADYFEPAKFDWSEEDYVMSLAVEKFSNSSKAHY
ncbi:MAG: hypothetical protein O3B01_12655 [Planctomycetota bacterium]|nr:hypothetical protein [Planctomycetota bacterium]MDA1139427.1 hypothetical protein [Planctomycetota bacterium]